MNHSITRFNFSSSSPPSSNVELYIPPGAAIIGFIGAITICLVGVFGNMLTIAALTKQLKQSGGGGVNRMSNGRATTTFVIHLAIADLLFCALVLPVTSGRYLTRSWPFGEMLCSMYPLFYYGMVATSLMLITMITINRFVLIAYDRHYNRIYTHMNVLMMIIFCWLFSYGLVGIPFAQLWGRFGYQANTFSCTILRDQRGRSPKKFLFIIGFFLPMSTIVICYGMIYIHIKRQTHLIQQHLSRRELKLTKLICVVFGAFLLCFLPLFIGNVFIPDNRYPYFHVFASMFAWLNSSINPFIYFAMNARYRQALRKLFSGNRQRSYSLNQAPSTSQQQHQSNASLTPQQEQQPTNNSTPPQQDKV